MLGTGGTIAGRAATPSSLAYESAQIGVDALVAALPTRLHVTSEQVAQLDSKDMDFPTWKRLAAAVERHLQRPDVAGVVVTHGTDTLEETAYFLSRVVDATRPVVLTAAMRPATSFEADGPRNLADAIVVAGAGSSAGATGVMVAFAGEIHAARHVSKAHPYRLDAFTSGEAGALGRVAEGKDHDDPPVAGRGACARRRFAARRRVVLALGRDRGRRRRERWPRASMRSSNAASSASSSRRPATAPCIARLSAALERAMAAGVAVLRATRCLDGRIVEDAPRTVPVGRRPHAGQGAHRADARAARAPRLNAARPRRGQTTSSSTSMLPRVAFEYGQTWCAASTIFCAAALSMPGIFTCSATWMPKPFGIWPMPTSAVIEVSAGRAIFCVSGHELHGADEAGRVAGGEELLGVRARRAIAAEALGRRQLDVEDAVVGLRGAFAAARRGGMGGVEDGFRVWWASRFL